MAANARNIPQVHGFPLHGEQDENRNFEVGSRNLLARRSFCRNCVASTRPNFSRVTENEILIGSCSALEGPSDFLGVETVTGAKAYFSLINEEGGVNGRKLKLLSADDSYDPAKTEACFEHLMSEKVFALGFFVGTPTAVKYVPMAESAKIPLVGLFTGAQTLYVRIRHWVVNVRASYL
jgi:branched-chain amino acid transport system substrate-binding protein